MWFNKPKVQTNVGDMWRTRQELWAVYGPIIHVVKQGSLGLVVSPHAIRFKISDTILFDVDISSTFESETKFNSFLERVPKTEG